MRENQFFFLTLGMLIQRKYSHQKMKNLILKIIPSKTTSLIQPLDIYFFRFFWKKINSFFLFYQIFRSWKSFVRKITEKLILEGTTSKVYSRDFIIKIKSLIHNQFSSPRYKDFIKYSWGKAGYIDNYEYDFVEPLKFCFDFQFIQKCSEFDCILNGFIRCSWCKKNFMYKGFYY